MAIATISNKGRTTIPRQIRTHLGLHAGDKIEFIIEEDGRVVLTPLTVHIRELKGILPKPKKAVSIEQMNEVIAKQRKSY